MSTWRPSSVPRSEREARRLDGPLEKLAADLGVAPPSVLGPVFTGWADLVGDQVAAHATPVSLRGGVLVVVVDQPAWATQLRFLSADVRRRLAEVAGDDAVREVQIRVRDDRSGRRRQGAGNRRPDTPT